MILEKTPVTMADAKAIVDKLEEADELKKYFKTFTKLTKDKADKLKEELAGLDNPKFREEHYVKMADFVPKDVEGLNKIFPDVGLTEEESNAILDITKKY